MHTHIPETMYPLTFRQMESTALGTALAHRHSVEFVGMKRVGISNFLRFFLYRPDVVATYVHKDQDHLFIPVDLNDLIERELATFWRLVLKRTVDIVKRNPDLEPLREMAVDIFRHTDKHDIFALVDGIRDIMVQLVEKGFLPTLFFLRFDRLKGVATQELFRNLQGMIDATNQKLAYVFTSYRELNTLMPEVFDKHAVACFADTLYLKPASEEDSMIIAQSLLERYHMDLSADLQKQFISLSGGHVQYLSFLLSVVHENKSLLTKKEQNVLNLLENDERIILQSEELFDALTDEERGTLNYIYTGNITADGCAKVAPYLLDTGYVLSEGASGLRFFSPFFLEYLKKHTHSEEDTAPKAKDSFTKKEQLLYTILSESEGKICEREDIVRYVWSECSELGVSDWAVDRLVSRLRSKLSSIDPQARIRTVKTRGFVLEK